MEFFQQLFKSLIPVVRASEPERSDNTTLARQEVSPSASSVSPGQNEVTSAQAPQDTKPEKEEMDISQGPDAYSDVLVGDDNEFFPERGNNRYRPSLFRTMFRFYGGVELARMKCETKLHDIIKKEPLIKLLLGALNTAGCPTDLRRNFSCEICYTGVYGGYDTETQQVVMCMNNVKDQKLMATILAHELIHMFDHCVNKTDFKVREHLACTEIRAINLTSCSLIDSFFSGYVSTMDLITKQYGKKHALCVKDRALKSVMAASTNLSEDDARQIIDRVFPYCYSDLEPIGRRLRHKTDDGDRAFYDGQHYGYV